MGALKKNCERVSLKKLSEKTGFAVSTVSGILNESPYCFAGESARKKVHDAARELGYYPNLLSRSLKSGKSNTIGLLVPSVYVNVTLSKIEMIEALAWEAGYHVFIGYSNNDTRKEDALLGDFMSRRVDGIVIVAGDNRGARGELENLVERDFPLVVIGEVRGYEDLNCQVVVSDYYSGGGQAAEHLLSLGHEKLCYVCFEHNETDSRISGFAAEAEKSGAEISARKMKYKNPKGNSIYDLADYVEAGFAAGKEIFGSGDFPTGIFASNDEIAAGLVKAALDSGVGCPGDVSIVGFDDSLTAVLSPVALTTVRQESRKICEIAMDILLRRLDGGAEPGMNRMKVPAGLVVRDSTGPAKVTSEKMNV